MRAPNVVRLALALITLNRKSVEERGPFVADGPRAIICFGPRRTRYVSDLRQSVRRHNAPLWVKSGNQASNIDVRLPIGCSLWLTALTKDHSKQHLFSCGSPE
jgi:hypothetical protein